MIKGFASIHPERLAAIFAIMAIIVVISATWFGQQVALLEHAPSCADVPLCDVIFPNG